MTTESGAKHLIDRVRLLCTAGVISSVKRDELIREVKDSFRAFADARDRLGQAAAQYDGLREEYVQCRRQGHSDTTYVFVGYNVKGGYGRCYEATCTRCGSIGRRFQKSNGMSNGSYREPPVGYSLEGLNARLRRCDVNAMEAVYEIEEYIARLEKEIPKEARRLRSVG